MACAARADDALSAWLAGDRVRARALLAPRAESGESRAAAMMAIDCRADPDADATRCVRWLERAAGAGSAAARHDLASALWRGEGIGQDRTRAQALWRQAATGGDAASQYNLAWMLLRADPAGHRAEARAWLTRAALAGLPQAQYALAVLDADAGGPTALRRAFAGFRDAAAGGYAPAQFNAALLLEARILGAPDLDAARRWLEVAAAQGFAPARDRLARHAQAHSAPTAPAAQESIAVRSPDLAAPPATPDTSDAGPIRDADWVRLQDPAAYTIQLAAGEDAAALRSFLDRTRTRGERACVPIRSGPGRRYAAIAGVYADPAQAREALAALPPAARGGRPWVRRFAELHALIAD
ncbi:MAG: SPOR domain-containing protein [Gammaproteobacteria bacterium]